MVRPFQNTQATRDHLQIQFGRYFERSYEVRGAQLEAVTDVVLEMTKVLDFFNDFCVVCHISGKVVEHHELQCCWSFTAPFDEFRDWKNKTLQRDVGVCYHC